MSEKLPVVYMARHGNTAWTLSGQHTGLTDLPLTPDGERNAVRLGERLKGMTFAKSLPALCSARPEPANCLGLEPGSITDPDLVEWDYGKYEGLTSAESCNEPRLATVSRRRSGRRIAGTNRRAGGPRGRARAQRRR